MLVPFPIALPDTIYIYVRFSKIGKMNQAQGSEPEFVDPALAVFFKKKRQRVSGFLDIYNKKKNRM